MEKFIRNILTVSFILCLLLIVWTSRAHIDISTYNKAIVSTASDTGKGDSIKLRYPIKQKDPYQGGNSDESPLYLSTPKNVQQEVEYDPINNEYIIKNKINNFEYSPTEYVPFKEYMEYDVNNALKDYWKERSEASNMSAEKNGLIPKIKIGNEIFDRIFGSSTIDIRPQGSAELTFGVVSNKRSDPSLNIKQRRITNFDFNEKIQMSVTAKIGDKINLGVNYNTEASFDFENKMKLAYEGKEDEIIKLIEAGNVSMPLNTTLIKGSQSLFGFKTKLQFGKVFVTGIFSEQQSKSQTINVTGGAQVSEFIIKADQYEDHKHYFASHYFRRQYETAFRRPPAILSNIVINKIEVWVSTSHQAAVNDNRNIIAFSDLGEESKSYNTRRDGQIVSVNLLNSKQVEVTGQHRYPDNAANSIYKYMDLTRYPQIRDKSTVRNFLNSEQFIEGPDYYFVEQARKLSPNEFTYNSRLGYLSINTRLDANSQILAVAYQYTVVGGGTYQVGEFSNDIPDNQKNLVLKLVAPIKDYNTKPIWNLMMKNVYSLNAYQVNKDNFTLNIFYTDNKVGVPTGYLNETRIKGIPLVRIMGLDRMDQQGNPNPDGVFDFIDEAEAQGGTIQSSNGRIFFTVLEPFGKNIRDSINPDGNNKALADKYAYDSLYSNTLTNAIKFPEKNKFIIKGTYKSASGSEIILNAMNIPQGSVKVTAGGMELRENQDYTVDYSLGRVKIINEGYLNSGQPIQISLENNSLFSIQKKTLMGTRVEYVANKDFTLGGTLMNLTERPITQKVNFGEEPISNTIWGMDVNYQKESNFITSLVDKLPFYQSKTPSNITINGEFANLIPGHSKAIGKTGISYIDDFEGSTSGYDLISDWTNWRISSTPAGQANLFPEERLTNDWRYGYNRAKLAWYKIDQALQITNNETPSNINKNDQSNNYARAVFETEVFPNKQSANGQPINMPVLNLSFYPNERGPYNFDVAGLNPDGTLKNPENRWGGMMRYISTTDFESANVEYVQFWMMDPFIKTASGAPEEGANVNGGELYINLGDISEDVLKDGLASWENGLPIDGSDRSVTYTTWAKVSNQTKITNYFDNDPEARQFQDVGLDGVGGAQEANFFKNYLDNILNNPDLATSAAYSNASSDPSSDNYRHWKDTYYNDRNAGILERYKSYNGMDGNSPVNRDINTIQSYGQPDDEDVNTDFNLSTSENYFQYKIDLRPEKMKIGENYIVDINNASGIKLRNGATTSVKWYQFKIPIEEFEKMVGSIQDFKSIRFIRLFLRGFTEPITCRFATLELVRSEWRKYDKSLMENDEYVPVDNNATNFSVSSVNIEENGKRSPIPYVIPPGIEREVNYASTNLQQLNEQSLDLKICNLMDGDARAIYKTSELDIRKYKKIKMYVHEEAQNSTDNLNTGDLTAFIRLGTDFIDNYYEYEVPLTPTPFGTSDPNLIWPAYNEFEVSLEMLTKAKQNRNVKLREPQSGVNLTTPYIEFDGKNKITVVGLPNLADVKTIMIGVRNPRRKSLNPNEPDDGLPKCANIWIDELRLSDFNEKGGWAAITRINTNLADLGNVTIAGNISTANFGSLEQNINTTEKASVMAYDVATNLELGKFFPEKTGIRIPMHFDYSQSFSNPEYDPLNPDILFKDDIKDYPAGEQRETVKKIAQDYTMRKNINFTNVKKVKTGSISKKPRVWDIENLDVSYAYSELFHRDADIEYNLEKKYRAGLNYNFMGNPKKVTPLNKIGLPSSRYFSLLKDFNIYFFPKLLSFHTEVNREFNENLLRNKTSDIIKIDTTYSKLFSWNRMYGVKWDFTQNLRMDYQAQAMAIIDEPAGTVSNYTNAKKDIIKRNFADLGRMNDYNQKLTLNYVVPINKIPFFDWLSVNTVYTGEYHWTSAPRTLKDSLGNMIENGNNKQININANLTNLYNKVPFIKKINDEDKIESRTNRINPSRYKNEGVPKENKNSRKSNKEKDDSLKEKTPFFKTFASIGVRLITSLKNISGSYNETNGTILPGFVPNPQIIGQDWSQMAPGTGFIFGDQTDIRPRAFRNNWIIQNNDLQVNPYIIRSLKNLAVRATLEPLPDLRIEVNATRTEAHTIQSILRYRNNSGGFDEFSKMETGNFSMSYFILPTAFIGDNNDNSNKIFKQFIEYTYQVAFRLAKEKYGSYESVINNYLSDSLTSIPDPSDDSRLIRVQYPKGFGLSSQNVLLPAFLAAYAKKNPSRTSELFPGIPLPNWRLTYTGLSKIDFFRRYIQSLTIGTAYTCNYNIANFATNQNNADGMKPTDVYGNFYPVYDIGAVGINEAFAPLINFDMVWVNSLLSKIEVRKSRNLSLSFANNQLTEMKSSEIVLGLGYRIKDVVFYVKGMNFSGKKKKLTSDINLKADVSIRTNKTVLRRVIVNSDETNQISAGQRVITINTSADYQISDRFTVRFYFDKVVNTPFISSQFPNSNTAGGLALRFTLAQ